MSRWRLLFSLTSFARSYRGTEIQRQMPALARRDICQSLKRRDKAKIKYERVFAVVRRNASDSDDMALCRLVCSSPCFCLSMRMRVLCFAGSMFCSRFFSLVLDDDCHFLLLSAFMLFRVLLWVSCSATRCTVIETGLQVRSF